MLQGESDPMNATTKTKYPSVQTARKLGIHPMYSNKNLELEEGEDYTVLTHKLHTDVHVPTMIEWSDGTVDDLKNTEESLKKAKEVA